MITTFQVGQRYSCRSLCDHDCVWTYEVTARTARFVTLTDGHEAVRVGVTVLDDVERCSPHGRYSMSPTLRASADEIGSCHHCGHKRELCPVTSEAVGEPCCHVCGRLMHDVDSGAQICTHERGGR